MRYDNDGRRVRYAQPSAVLDYDESQNDLAVTLKPDEGRIQITEYYASTNDNGAAAGYLKAQKLRRGSDGPEVLLRSMKYASYSFGGFTISSGIGRYRLPKRRRHRQSDHAV